MNPLKTVNIFLFLSPLNDNTYYLKIIMDFLRRPSNKRGDFFADSIILVNKKDAIG